MGFQEGKAMQLLTLRETAKALRVCYATAVRLAKKGELPAVRVGGQWRVPEADLVLWLEGKKNPRQ
jgi:excisionase family DNA binding protein